MLNEIKAISAHVGEKLSHTEFDRRVDVGKSVKEISRLIDKNPVSEISSSIERKRYNFDTRVEKKEVHENDGFTTPYKERIDHTPLNGGEWTGERGESIFISDDPKAQGELKRYGLDGIEYKNGYPDFKQCSEAQVGIDNMTSDRPGNFRQADAKLAEQFNEKARDGRTDWTTRNIEKYRSDSRLTWHEEPDMKSCTLVPTDIHSTYTHSGGVSECRHTETATGVNKGDIFDE